MVTSTLSAKGIIKLLEKYNYSIINNLDITNTLTISETGNTNNEIVVVNEEDVIKELKESSRMYNNFSKLIKNCNAIQKDITNLTDVTDDLEHYNNIIILLIYTRAIRIGFFRLPKLIKKIENQ